MAKIVGYVAIVLYSGGHFEASPPLDYDMCMTARKVINMHMKEQNINMHAVCVPRFEVIK